MNDSVSPSLLNDSGQAQGLLNAAYDLFSLDLTTDLYNDFDTTGAFESSVDTNTGPFGIVYGLNTNLFDGSHSASHLNDTGQNT